MNDPMMGQERNELLAEVDAAWEQVKSLRAALMYYGHEPDCSFLLGGSVDCYCPNVVPTQTSGAAATDDELAKLLGDCIVADCVKNQAETQRVLDAVPGLIAEVKRLRGRVSTLTTHTERLEWGIERLREAYLAACTSRMVRAREIERLRELLRMGQWIAVSGAGRQCPYCAQLESDGHALDCAWAGALQ